MILAGVIGKDEEGEFLRKFSAAWISLQYWGGFRQAHYCKKRIGTRDQLIVRVDRK